MSSLRTRGLPLAVVVSFWAAIGCGPDQVSVGDDGSVPGDGDSASEGPLDAEARPDSDADGEALDGGGDGAAGALVGPGPITTVIYDLDLIEERLCDLDGDGLADNAVADLGSPSARLFAVAISSFIEAELRGRARVCTHTPWLVDRSIPREPDATVIIFQGRDLDEPSDSSDDFAGGEPFGVEGVSVDVCGEPLFYTEHVRIDGPSFSYVAPALPLPLTHSDDDMAILIQLRQVSIDITLDVADGGGAFDACGYLLASELGANAGYVTEGDHSALELLLAGGAAIGVAGMPGVAPDVDLDGDGLERFTLDEVGLIERCVDGDGTIIEGRDCWQDERIADGFGISVHATLVKALLGGHRPDPRYECDEVPEQSLWDPPE